MTASTKTDKPLFIPLKTAYYEAFCSGQKTTEYRPNGPRWNRHTCRVGRRVVISKGYGKHARREGVITSFEVSAQPTQTDAWRDCYGSLTAAAACITIKLDEVSQ